MKFMSKLGLNDVNCQSLVRSQNQYLDNSNYQYEIQSKKDNHIF